LRVGSLGPNIGWNTTVAAKLEPPCSSSRRVKLLIAPTLS
jgi:hypothetical protein